MHRFLSTLVVCILAGSLASNARADVGPPLEIQLLGPPRPAEVGQVFSDTIRLTADVDLVANNFEFEPSPGWSVLSFDPPGSTDLLPGEPFDLPFVLLAVDPEQVLVFTLEVDGEPARQYFDLSPRRFHRDDAPLLVLNPVSGTGGATHLARAGIDETSASPDHEHARIVEGEALPSGARVIRVRGRILMQRYRYDFPTDAVLPLDFAGVDGMTVRVYSDAVQFGADTTYADGVFDIQFTWVPCLGCGGSQPDLWIRAETVNSKVRVAQDLLTSTPYRFKTKVVKDFTGTDLDFGDLTVGGTTDNASLHLMTVLTRSWRYVDAQGYNIEQVRAFYFPINFIPYYTKNRIFASRNRVWDDGTLVHEYGHFFIDKFGNDQDPKYCNAGGFCDGPCGHCVWCQENAGVAWGEGWPDFLATMVLGEYPAVYGSSPITGMARENTPATCLDWQNNPCACNPYITEGFLGALLNDIADGANETTGTGDALSLGVDEIFTVTTVDKPTTPQGFLDKFLARYPEHKEAFWRTARLNGYDPDVEKPGASPFFTSPSHAINVPSPDGTVDLAWTEPYDDVSGVSGYSLLLTTTGPALPPAFAQLGDVTSMTTSQLTPGTYWMNLRAQDASGKWSDVFATLGPIVIRPLDPADVGPGVVAGWAYPLVPRPAADVTVGNVPAPSILSGETNTTYWNLPVNNHGEQRPNVDFVSRLLVDGVETDLIVLPAWLPLDPGTTYQAVNLGPVTVRGGRHTFGAWVDAAEVISENSEIDNFYWRQWVWTPLTLAPGPPIWRNPPPSKTGGWYPGAASYYNCDGVRVNVGFGLWGLWAYGYDVVSQTFDDYDVRLHTASSDASVGFDVINAQSQLLEGYLDAVLFFHPIPFAADYDVGILNYSGSAGFYQTQLVEAQVQPFGVASPSSWTSAEMLALRTVVLDASQVGPITVTLDVSPATGPVHLQWYDKSFTSGGLINYTYRSTTDAAGRARLNIPVPEIGLYFLSMHRDPKNTAGPVSLTLTVESSPPDYTPYYAAGWHAPLVPLPAPDGTPGSVPPPTALSGDANATYLNLAVQNASPGGGTGLTGAVAIDGQPLASYETGSLPAGTPAYFNDRLAYTVPGGRHTLTVQVTATSGEPELNTADNGYGEQWVWTPSTFSLPHKSHTISRPQPPPLTGGWDVALASGNPLWFNCDGLRMDVLPDARTRRDVWYAMASMPSSDGNVELRLHEGSDVADAGFDEALAISAWGNGESDYVLVNTNKTASRPFDVGVLDGGGTGGYLATVAGSAFLGSDPQGSQGPFFLTPGEILSLHEMWLSPGSYVVHLTNLDGQVDYGMSLHLASLAFQSKSSALPGGISWLAPVGHDEGIAFEVPAADYYCLSVWKQGAGDLNLDGQYQLEFTSVTAVDGAPPPRSVLSSVFPNPFNPRLSIRFELDDTRDVKIDVFNVRGELVRSVVRDTMPTGRHLAVWDGTDDRRHRVANGVYFVRMLSDGQPAGTLRAVLME